MVFKQSAGARALFILIALTFCNTIHAHPTEEMIAARSLMLQLQEAYLTQNVDGAMELLSSSASPSLVNTFLQGNFEITGISTHNATARRLDDNRVQISPIVMTIDKGTFFQAFSITLQHESGVWKISAMEDTTSPNQAKWLPELDNTVPVTFALTDADSQEPVHARVHIRDESGDYWPVRGHQKNIRTGWRDDVGGDVFVNNQTWAYVTPGFVADLPIGNFVVEVARGPEYLPHVSGFSVKDQRPQTVTIALQRVIDMNRLGWYSGDNHAHFLSDQTAMLEARGEDLNVVNVLATKWGELITDVTNFTGAQSAHSDNNHIVYVNEETRHRFLGHTILHPLKELVYPLSWGGPGEGIPGGFDYPPMAHQADRARAQGALVTWAHFPFPAGELAVDVALGKIDTVDLFTWGDAFANVAAGTTPGALRVWYAMLNTGANLTATAGTDKMLNTQVSGSVRMYADLKRRRLNYDNWADAIRQGKTFVTTGPMIFLTANGKGIGSELTSRSGKPVKLKARIVSIRPVRELQIIQDGNVIAEVKNPGGLRELELEIDAAPRQSTWFAARAYDPQLLPYQRWSLLGPVGAGVPLMAHTSPIYVNVDNQSRTSAEDAALLLGQVDEALEWLNSTARFKQESQREEVRALYEQARRHYEQQQ